MLPSTWRVWLLNGPLRQTSGTVHDTAVGTAYSFAFHLIVFGKSEFQILSFCLIFRPSFRCFTWHTCTLGILGCLVMMFLINAFYAFASIAFMLLLLMLIPYLGPISNWGYISQALIFHQVQKQKKRPSLSHDATVECMSFLILTSCVT